MDNPQYHAIGKPSIRKDGIAKVTGQELYTTDVSLPRMLHARVLRSPFPHAKVKGIDTREAEKLGAVGLTPREVPNLIYAERIVTIPSRTFKDRRVLTDTPRHVGEAVAARAPETEERAERAPRLCG